MTTTLQELKLSQIKPHKLNPRRAVGDVTELAASIAEQGIVEPLVVAPNGAEDTYVLLAGHRRLAAAKVAKAKTVPCLVRDDLTDPKKQLELMLVENLQRSDLTPIEEAEAYQQLLEFPGYTQKRIADTTGRAVATVRQRLKMAALPKPAITKIHEGQISLGEAAALVDFADDKKRYKQLEDAAGSDRFPYVLERLKADRARDRKRERTLKELSDAGVRVVEQPLWSVPHVQMSRDEIEGHRECEGFAAYLDWNLRPVYICDKPDLHGDERERAAAERRRQEQNEAAEMKDRLAEAAVTRRSYLAQFLDNATIGGIALDVLRQHVLKKAASCHWLGDVLGYEASDGKERTVRIGELDLDQLAVVVDLLNFDYEEKALEGEFGWGGDSYAGKWRTRLTDVYGYTWSEQEQAAIDRAEAKRAERSAAQAAPDDEDLDEDDVDEDFDDNPEWPGE